MQRWTLHAQQCTDSDGETRESCKLPLQGSGAGQSGCDFDTPLPRGTPGQPWPLALDATGIREAQDQTVRLI